MLAVVVELDVCAVVGASVVVTSGWLLEVSLL